MDLCDNGENLLFDPDSLHAWRMSAGAEVIERSEAESSLDQRLLCCCGLKATTHRNVSDFQPVSVAELLTTADVGRPGSSCMFASDLKGNFTEDFDVHKDAILDNFGAFTSALKQGVATANLVLSIGQFIVDRN